MNDLPQLEYLSRLRTLPPEARLANHQAVFTAINDTGTKIPETVNPFFFFKFLLLPAYGESDASTSNNSFNLLPEKAKQGNSKDFCSFVPQSFIKCSFFVLFLGFYTGVNLAMKTMCKKSPWSFLIRWKQKRRGKETVARRGRFQLALTPKICGHRFQKWFLFLALVMKETMVYSLQAKVNQN